MRLEILVDSEDPLIFPLNKPKVFIGSNEACDIVLNTHGVSRKHIAVVSEGDAFFVIDQGSTNGSYINEERLVPGRRVEFTSFFPVRLGDDVLLTLLSDEEGGDSLASFNIPATPQPELPQKEATTMISLKDLKAASTEGLVKKRQEVVKRRATVQKKVVKKQTTDKDRMRNMKIIAGVFVVGAVYYNYFIKEPPVVETPPAEINRVVDTPVEKPLVPKPGPESAIKLIDKSEWVSKTSFPSMLNDLKCTTDAEKLFCLVIKGASAEPWGVVQIGTSLVILVDATEYLELAKPIVEKTPQTMKPSEDPTLPPVPQPMSEEDYSKILQSLFVWKAVPAELDVTTLKDFKIFVALFKGRSEVVSVGAYDPESLKKLRARMRDEDFRLATAQGKRRIMYTQAFFNAY